MDLNSTGGAGLLYCFAAQTRASKARPSTSLSGPADWAAVKVQADRNGFQAIRNPAALGVTLVPCVFWPTPRRLCRRRARRDRHRVHRGLQSAWNGRKGASALGCRYRPHHRPAAGEKAETGRQLRWPESEIPERKAMPARRSPPSPAIGGRQYVARPTRKRPAAEGPERRAQENQPARRRAGGSITSRPAFATLPKFAVDRCSHHHNLLCSACGDCHWPYEFAIIVDLLDWSGRIRSRRMTMESTMKKLLALRLLRLLGRHRKLTPKAQTPAPTQARARPATVCRGRTTARDAGLQPAKACKDARKALDHADCRCRARGKASRAPTC